jgi:hypothetical protein
MSTVRNYEYASRDKIQEKQQDRGCFPDANLSALRPMLMCKGKPWCMTAWGQNTLVLDQQTDW